MQRSDQQHDVKDTESDTNDNNFALKLLILGLAIEGLAEFISKKTGIDNSAGPQSYPIQLKFVIIVALLRLASGIYITGSGYLLFSPIVQSFFRPSTANASPENMQELDPEHEENQIKNSN